MPSSISPTPFAGVPEACPQGAEPGPLAVAAAGELLAGRGVFGVVWLDLDLIVRARYGTLVDFIPIGRPITAEVLALTGLEEDILALRDAPDRLLDLPAVALISAHGQTPRLNLILVWHAKAERILMIASRAVSRSDLEAQLVAQMRARLLAESEVSAKSRELARTNAELSRANRDLEDFASIISHDLAAPMRAMRYLVDDLEAGLVEPQSAPPTPDPRAVIKSLRQHTRRLSTMLRELHDYSSIGRKQDAIERVETAALIAAVTASIPRPPGFSITVDGNWPAIDTLAAPLDLVLRNLVDNAVKHHDCELGSIRVRCDERETTLDISVTDDGPGISESVRDAVFLPFRTLGRPGAGTGMGLALVKRTIESVGGTLTLTSKPGVTRGCVFRILWPKRIVV